MDVANDMLDFENSITQHLRAQDGLKKISLYNLGSMITCSTIKTMTV